MGTARARAHRSYRVPPPGSSAVRHRSHVRTPSERGRSLEVKKRKMRRWHRLKAASQVATGGPGRLRRSGVRKLAQTRSLTLQVAGIVTCGTAMRALPTCCAACLVHTELALGDIEPAVPARHWATRALVAGVLGHEPPRWANNTAGIRAAHRLVGAAAAEVRVELAQRAFPPARREVERVVRVRACNAEREHHVLDRPVTHETIERNRVAAGGTRRPLDQVCAVAALAERVALRAAARGHPQHEGADAAGEILVAARVDQHGVDHWLAVRELGSGCGSRRAGTGGLAAPGCGRLGSLRLSSRPTPPTRC
eukprot:scaffold44416_cov59-Phaeocystis_antarctica.AAC.1